MYWENGKNLKIHRLCAESTSWPWLYLAASMHGSLGCPPCPLEPLFAFLNPSWRSGPQCVLLCCDNSFTVCNGWTLTLVKQFWIECCYHLFLNVFCEETFNRRLTSLCTLAIDNKQETYGFSQERICGESSNYMC